MSSLPLGNVFLFHFFVVVFLNPCTHQKFVILEHSVAHKQFLWCIRGGVNRCSRKKSVVTNIGGKWQPVPLVSRLTWREMLKRGKRKWRREGEAGGVWHYSITIRAVLDFPTFQNEETNFSLFPFWIPQEESHYFSRQPWSLYPLPAPTHI